MARSVPPLCRKSRCERRSRRIAFPQSSKMQLLELLRKESTSLRRDIVLAASLSGLSSAAVLAIINDAARTASSSSLNLRYLVMFVIAVSLYIVCLRYTFDSTTRLLENIIENIRTRIADKIRHSELNVLDNLGKAEIYNRLTQETATISQFKGLLAAALQSAVIVIFVSLYIAVLSWYAFIIVIVLMAIGVFLYLQADRECRSYIERTSQKEIEFFDSVTHIIDGFQEIKVNQRRSDDIFQEAQQLSTTVKDFKVKTDQLYNDNYILSQSLFYFILAAIVFVLPRLVPTYTDVVAETTTAIMFIIGPLSTVVGAIPNLAKANIAIEHIFDLERRLDVQQAGEASSVVSTTPPIAFTNITLTDVEFTYEDRYANRLF